MTLTITYHGHSTLTLDADGVKLVVDPFFAPNNPAAKATVNQIDADYILLTHGHGDHVADAVALAKRTGALVISNFEVVSWMQAKGAPQGHGMNTGGAYSFPFGRVKLTVALHSSTMPDGSSGGDPNGILVTFNDGHDVYFAGDTALTYDMKLIGEGGGVDLAVLPIGDNFTMGPDDALRAVKMVKPRMTVPCHYNTWPPIAQDAEAWAKRVEAETDTKAYPLQPGQSLEI